MLDQCNPLSYKYVPAQGVNLNWILSTSHALTLYVSHVHDLSVYAYMYMDV